SSAPGSAEQLQSISENSLNSTFSALQFLGDMMALEAEPVGRDAGKTDFKLIPRQLLFGIPERVGVLISPDGNWLSYLSAENGYFNIWIAPVNRVRRSSEEILMSESDLSKADASKDDVSESDISRADLSRARMITNETIRGIESYFWANNGRHIIFIQDTFGDENWRSEERRVGKDER